MKARPTHPAGGSERERESIKPPSVPDHELLRCVGQGSYGEVWLARNVLGAFRAVKIVYRRNSGQVYLAKHRVSRLLKKAVEEMRRRIL